MKNAITRILGYEANLMSAMGAQMVVATVALTIWFKLTLSFATVSFPFIVVILLATTGIFLELAWFSNICKNILGFNISRENFYISSAIIKTAYALIATVAFFATCLFSGTLAETPAKLFLAFFVVTFALEFLGDFYGMMLTRFGKLGFTLYVVSFVFIMLGITSCLVFVLVSQKEPFILLLSSIFSPPVILGILAVTFTLFVVNWLLVKNLEIKS